MGTGANVPSKFSNDGARCTLLLSAEFLSFSLLLFLELCLLLGFGFFCSNFGLLVTIMELCNLGNQLVIYALRIR